MEKKYKYCSKEKKLIEITCREHSDESRKDSNEKLAKIVFDGDSASVFTETAEIFKNSNDFFSNLPSELCTLNLTKVNYERAMGLIINIVEHTKELSLKLVQKNCKESISGICKNIEKGANHILNKLNEIKTTKKLKKTIRKNPLFVEPVPKSIGLKWKTAKVDPDTNIPDHGLVQSTFQYVPILETLKSLFSNKDFYEAYIRYNLHDKHKCDPSIYEDFCCGSIHKSIEIFKNPLALQLQIGTDDFEVCCAVKSKATKHKVNATYIQIKNMPFEYRSKLNNIYLVALCSSVNFKSKEYDYNHIAELICDELAVLEISGLEIDHEIFKGTITNINEDFKGTLTNIAVDNLGASTVLGMAESFSATYFCRHCECPKNECQIMTKENKRKRRKIAKYDRHVEMAENDNMKMDLVATMGIKRHCKFNDLKYFHMLDNMSVDVMHDVNEGSIAYCLSDFFDLIVKKVKILTETELQQRVRDFNYGPTRKYNKPSLINLEKHNLNQNASQLYCLMVNVPFILLDLKKDILPYWQPVQTLLNCMQVIYSPKICEQDIKSREKFIHQHLTSVQDIFKRKLTPKHHFLVHYPEYIRRMGPPIHHWTMRLESKHRVLTEISRRKMNFISLTKTLANEHQERICMQPVLRTEIKPSKSSGQFSKSMQFQKFEDILKRDIGSKYREARVHNFAAYDTLEYRQGCLLIENGRLYEIANILSVDSKVFLLCHLHKIVAKDKFSVSLVIERMHESAVVFDFDKIEHKPVFDKIFADHKNFIIAENLIVAKLK